MEVIILVIHLQADLSYKFSVAVNEKNQKSVGVKPSNHTLIQPTNETKGKTEPMRKYILKTKT